MREELVVTIIGLDKPGLVESLARCVASHGGNWEASRMAIMAGRFAGILRASVPAERASELERALADLEATGLRLHIERGAVSAAEPSHSLRLELVGPDRLGVVRDVSTKLAGLGVNIVELDTEIRDAPMSGEQLLRVEAVLASPLSVGLDQLRAEIETSAADFMMELDVEETG